MNKTINPNIISFYYKDRDEIPEVNIDPAKTALLIMNMQKYQIGRIVNFAEEGIKSGEGSAWKDFSDRFDYITLPAIQEIQLKCRELGIKVCYGNVVGLAEDESLNELIGDFVPDENETIYERRNKVGSSVTAGTSFVADMREQGIDTIIVTGVATDQSVSSSIRVLSDEGFKVICCDDACAADSMEQHEYELRALNFTYCLVVSLLQMMEMLDK